MKRGLFILFFLLLINILFISADSCSTLISYDYSKISGGQYHTCGIRANDSRVLCWGRGSSGQLGDGGTGYNSVPTLTTDLSVYVSVSSGNLHTCGIRKNDSRVLCWGEGNLGQLGDGSTGDNLIPTLISDSSAYSSISAGGYHTCGIRANDSRVLCWGEGVYGMLGDGNVLIHSILIPNLINDTSAYKSLDTISDFTCGIRANDSRVLCWGRGDYGKLGDGNTNVHNVPNPILTTDSSMYSEISTGAFHTCGIRTSDSRVLCWGRGISGRLGDGIASDHSVGNPTLTQDSSASRDLNSGFSHNCVIRKSDSRVLCWGYGFLGQLGNGGTADKSVPTLTTDVFSYTILTTGAQHSCGIRTNDSKVLCWGEGNDGQLGDGSIVVHKVLSPNLIIDPSGYSTDETCGFSCISNSCGDGIITGGEECDDGNLINSDGCSSTCMHEVFNSCDYFKLSAGSYQTCGIRANDSRVLCWGYGWYGILGDGITSNHKTFSPNLTTDVSPYLSISTGGFHTCGIRANDSRVLCWGSGNSGALGDGILGNHNVGNPNLTVDSSAYLSISTGLDHTCGIRASDSRVLCWGLNDYGQLGNGTVGGFKAVPTLTTDTSAYSSISAGWIYTCGIRANDSRVLCWGDMENAKLGNGQNSFISNPNPNVTTDKSAYKQVNAGFYSTCGIRANDSRVLCWGRGIFGILGDGITIEHLARNPTLTTDTSEYKQISPYRYHTCGIRANDSRILCWGRGEYGVLGNGGTLDTGNPKLISEASGYTQVSVGLYHSCATRFIDGRVLCWGRSLYGQLGDGIIMDHMSLNPNVTIDSSGYNVSENFCPSVSIAVCGDGIKEGSEQCDDKNLVNGDGCSASCIIEVFNFSASCDDIKISAGWSHTCGIRKNDSRVLCWGNSVYGQLGDGQNILDRLSPYTTSDISGYISVSARGYQTCGIRTSDRRVLCWGYGKYGALGDGDIDGHNVMNPTLTTDSSAYLAVSVGDYNHVCGIRANDSRVLCWGYSNFGQLGNGGFSNLGNPTLINDTSAYKSISAGDYYTCGIRKNDSRVLCWGYGGEGQLGDGRTLIVQLNPNVTTDTSEYKSIYSDGHTCGIRKNDSRVLCWGYGGEGQLGDGETEDNLIPTLTTDTSAYKKIATGDYHSCGIRANDSRVLCWGDGGDGELGNGGFTNLNKPTLTSDISAYIQISAGSYYSCGTRLNDTRILCWGLNDDGQLGTGNTNELFIPTLTTDISSYSSNNLSCDLVNTSNNCGNGIKESPEECDDKNLINGDGCSNVCILQPEAYFVDSNGLRITEAYIGETVKLVLNNTGILNGSFNFEIFEDDSVFDDEIRTGSNAISGTFSNVGWGIIIGEWTITEEDYAKTNDYDGFYFKINGYESGKLTVLVQDSTAECKDYENKLSCNSCDNFGCNAAENNVNEKVFKAYPEVWNNTRCGDEILVSGLCNYLMQCKCVWDDILNACSYTWEFIPGLDCGSTPIIGLCSYSESSNDNCEDGFLEYSWTTIWSWGADNGYADFNDGPSNNIDNYFLQNGLYYYDPLKLSRVCVGGSNAISCPAKIQLPFFGFYNLIITILLILGIYYLIYLRKD